eukprot:gnl/TRDRNA2_/TRDRNA2_145347_c0_seq1.p2 gnl/TRDRNA2_/TRDRNA2_145347_c0~~gnl/TRDRNA2_/TRDRNA2_145347_c0_seq1.p2  ORF type:complete len:109 (+),score=2.57 gnl/TRDRNA2_/TRDRNA2_145347_c0_seq1:184-510(+)
MITPAYGVSVCTDASPGSASSSYGSTSDTCGSLIYFLDRRPMRTSLYARAPGARSLVGSYSDSLCAEARHGNTLGRFLLFSLGLFSDLIFSLRSRMEHLLHPAFLSQL